ncbi:class I SAM-dependent methyltransferase [Peribacillus sp. SCS-26]|uniref:class I SAM-dependent methyltransferase n=1 Tax=Paraperibacillus marinus TaxID=3115295 RepID=UPI0039060B41
MLEQIKETIRQSENGLISYREFISLALYAPNAGYYASDRVKIGRSGDFYTSANVSDILGTVLGKWFGFLIAHGKTAPVICELGGGTGRLARSVLDALKLAVPEIYHEIKYMMVETSPYHISLQKESLREHPAAVFLTDIEEAGNLEGILFSNEFFDAFPVSVIEMRDGELFEVFVGLADGRLIEKPVILRDPAILRFLAEGGWQLSEGQRLEVPLDMLDYLDKIDRSFSKGVMLTLDYGYTQEEWMAPEVRSGSLRAYHKHTQNHDVLARAGEMDITAHIHWDAMRDKLRGAGFVHRSLLRQDEFLLKAGILDELTAHTDPDPFSAVSSRNRAARSLITPGGISSSFRVSLDTRNMEEAILFPNEKPMELK